MLDDTFPNAARKGDGIFFFREILDVLGVIEVGNLGDSGRYVGFIAGIEPVAAAPATIGADDDAAWCTAIRHAVVKNLFVDDISHI